MDTKNSKKEEKHNRFKKLAVLRTNNVLYRLQVLGNCANRSAYAYSNEEVKKIFDAIEEELQTVKAKFKDSKRKNFEL